MATVLSAALAPAMLPAEPAVAAAIPGTFAIQVAGGMSSVHTYLRSTDSGQTFTMAPSTWAGGVKITTSGFTIELDPAAGSALTTDTTLDASASHVTGRPAFAILGQPDTSTSCSHITVHVREVDRDASGAITGVAASFQTMCDATNYYWGEIQYGVALPFGMVAASTSTAGVFPDTQPSTTSTHTLTLTSVGTGPVQLGAASMRGPATSTFGLTNDTCANTTLAAGNSCTVDAQFTPTTTSTFFATLVYGADSFAGESTFALYGRGADVPSAPSLSAIAGDDGIELIATPAANSGAHASITGYSFYRDDAPSSPLVTQSGTTYVDPVPGGTSHTYTVVANSATGSSASSASATATALAKAATPGNVDAFTTDSVEPASVASYVDDPTTLGPVAPDLVTFVGSQPSEWINFGTTVAGTRITPGTYVSPNVPTVTSPWNQLSCPPSIVHVYDADIRADGTPDVLTADYTLDCANGYKVSGEIRWNSSVGYHADSVSPSLSDAGGIPVGSTGPAPALTVTNTGTLPLDLGQLTVTGTDSSDFGITADTCSGQNLDPAATCTVQAAFTPSSGGRRTAALILPANTPEGEIWMPLHGSGAGVPDAPFNPYVLPGAGHQQVNWGQPGSDGGAKVTSYKIYRGGSVDALDPSPLATVDGSTFQWTDRSAVAGRTYVYAVVAVNAAGDGAYGMTAPVTALQDEVVFADDLHGLGNYSLLTGDGSGGPTTTLLDDGSDNGEPTVSPDGTKVAYVSNNGGTYHIWVMPLDGSSAPRQLTNGSAEDDWPAWSPDGKTIAFANDATGIWRLQTVSLDGSVTVVPDGSNLTRPSYSPSGRELIAGLTTGNHGVDVVSLQDGSRRHVTGSDYGVDPQVSPDGRTIAMAVVEGQATDECHITYPKTHLATIPYIGGTAKTIATGGGRWLDDPSWSPDGTKIVSDVVALFDGCLGQTAVDTWNSSGGILAVRGWGLEPSIHSAIPVNRPVTAPGPVTSLVGTLSSGTVSLSWKNPTTANLWKAIVRRSLPGGAAPTSPSAGISVPFTGTTSAKATGLVNGKAYQFSIFTIDNAGTVTRTVLTAMPLTVPTITNTLLPAGPTFTVAWKSTGATAYDVDYIKGTGHPNLVWLSNTKSLSGVFGGANKPALVTAGSVWTFDVRARDPYGNATAWSAVRQVHAG